MENNSDSEEVHENYKLLQQQFNLLSERQRAEQEKQDKSKKSELPFENGMKNLRNDYFLALEEKKMGFTKKKLFNKKDTRCLQSKINLKFPIKDMLKDKPKEQIQVKEGVIQEFEKHYKEMCN